MHDVVNTEARSSCRAYAHYVEMKLSRIDAFAGMMTQSCILLQHWPFHVGVWTHMLEESEVVTPDPILNGQESVWSYPRPAVAEPTDRHLTIVHAGVTIADTRRGVRTLETSHPPGYYFPPYDVSMPLLRRSAHRSFCEWKGEAIYYDVIAGGEILENVVWSYPEPNAVFDALRGFFAFYPRPFDGCFVDDERVVAQPGEFYGGWITSHVAGPFKGVPGSRFW